MDVPFVGSGTQQKVAGWQRVLGVTLRPWAGHSPWSLIVRGVIQAGICVVFMVLGYRALQDESVLGAGTEAELGLLRNWMGLAFIALIAIAAYGATQLIVGALDLVPRKKVTGTIISLRERQFLDFLPHFVLAMIFNRRNNSMGVEQRRRRTEVVLDTPDGQKQWTVRSHRTRRKLQSGGLVTLSVTPLAGYVASVEQA